MAKSSELIASGAPSPAVFGIEIDVDDVTPPEGLEQAAIVCPIVNGDIPDEILDVAISWTLAGCDVTLEIPSDSPVGDAKRLLSTVAAVGISLSLLPPEGEDAAALEAYMARVEEFTRAYVRQGNMAKLLVPVTSYLGYMFIEVLDKAKSEGFVPSDPYILERFHSKVPVGRADQLKARIRSVFHEAYGGEEGFRRFALQLTGAIYRKVEEGCVEESARQQTQVPQTEAH